MMQEKKGMSAIFLEDIRKEKVTTAITLNHNGGYWHDNSDKET